MRHDRSALPLAAAARGEFPCSSGPRATAHLPVLSANVPSGLIVPGARGPGPPRTFRARLNRRRIVRLRSANAFVVEETRVGAGRALVGGPSFVAHSRAQRLYACSNANTSVLAVQFPALQGANMPYGPPGEPRFRADRFRLQLAAAPRGESESALPVPCRSSSPGRKATRASSNFATRGGSGRCRHLTYELFRMETGILRRSTSLTRGGSACASPRWIAGTGPDGPLRPGAHPGQERRGCAAPSPSRATSRDAELPGIPTLAESGYPAVTSTLRKLE